MDPKAIVNQYYDAWRLHAGDMSAVPLAGWEMAFVPGALTAAEVLEVRHGTLVRDELIHDAEALRRAIAKSGT